MLFLLLVMSLAAFIQPIRADEGETQNTTPEAPWGNFEPNLEYIETEQNFTDEEQWENFKAQYDRNFTDPEWETRRQKLFLERLSEIENHNAEYKAGNQTYWRGVNQFTDMTDEEIDVYSGCLLSEEPEEYFEEKLFEAADVGLPESMNWVTKGHVTPVKTQGRCGSCYAFATAGAIEGQRRHPKSLSAQNLVDCSTPQGNKGCRCGLMINSYKYVMKYGIDTEKYYPYEARVGKCRYNEQTVGARITGYRKVQNREAALKTAVATKGPVAVGIAAPKEFKQYKGGIFNDPNCGERPTHAVLVVGYGTSKGQDYWIVKNSYGPGWGDEGYILMTRNKNNQCAIASMASYPEMKKSTEATAAEEGAGANPSGAMGANASILTVLAAIFVYYFK